MKGVDKKQLAVESPSTKQWFDVSEVLGRTGDDWQTFSDAIKGAIGI